MREANPHLSREQARHLTIWGIRRNENGTYSWKFDNYVHATSPYMFNNSRRARNLGAHHLPDFADSRHRVVGRRLGQGRPHPGVQERARSVTVEKGRPLGASRSASTNS